MSWRIVVISQRCKLDYSMNYLIIRGIETKRVFIDEIAILLIENNAVSLTGCLLSALTENKIKVIFCDGKRNPQSELISIYGAHNDSRKIRQQIAWKEQTKKQVWTQIVREKILNQSIMLSRAGKDDASELLRGYAEELTDGDVTNREGFAAKVYFNAMFGMEFTRTDDENPVNVALNYGYSLILSAFNREIVASGYLTQLGLAHENQYNHFNLSCDLMEPFRIVIDSMVWQNNYTKFDKDEKYDLVRLLTSGIKIKDNEQTLLNAIGIYTKTVLDALNEDDEGLIRFIEI